MKSSKLPNTNKLYVGIDQSVVCTSLAFLKNGEITFHRIKEDVRGPELLSIIYQRVCSSVTAQGTNPAGVAIEGYAYGAKGAYFNLGEIGGVIRLAVQQHHWPLIQVPPTVLKKHITGKGTSPKDIMIKEMYKKYDLDINDNNDADAAGLALLCYEFYETQFHIVKAYRTDLHKTCEMIIGDHPNEMSHKEFLKDMPADFNVAQWERQRKKKK
jgi:Holliday junction resolvasome RuvABC endonuclease subunit